VSGRDDLGDMTPEEIADWAARDWAAAKAAHEDDPLPVVSRAKRDDHPHWEVVAYMFHTRAGERVLVDRGDGGQVEGTLGGVRPARGQDELLVELEGTTWACTRADGEQWAPGDRDRVRVETLTVPVVVRPRADTAGRPERWTLQTNMEGQP
jgi:hypothetical protein